MYYIKVITQNSPQKASPQCRSGFALCRRRAGGWRRTVVDPPPPRPLLLPAPPPLQLQQTGARYLQLGAGRPVHSLGQAPALIIKLLACKYHSTSASQRSSVSWPSCCLRKLSLRSSLARAVLERRRTCCSSSPRPAPVPPSLPLSWSQLGNTLTNAMVPIPY